MKKNLFLFASLAAVAASGNAATEQLFMKGDQLQSATKMNEQTSAINEMKRLPLAQLQAAQKSATAAAEQLVTVKFVLSMDPQEYKLDDFYSPFAFNDKYYFMGQGWSYDSSVSGYVCELEMPAGSYDFIALFQHIDAGHVGGYDHNAWVIKESVSVSDQSVVTLDPAEAVNHISFVSYMPDGQEMVMNKGRFIDTNYTYEIVEPGTVKNIGVLNVASHRDYGMFDYVLATPSYREATEAIPTRADGVAQLDVYVNDVSEKYEFKQVRLANTDDDAAYVVAFHQYGSSQPSDVVTNSPATYFEIDGTMASNPLLENADPNRYYFEYSVNTGATLEGGRIPGAFQGISSEKPKTHIFVSSGAGNEDYPLGVISLTRGITDMNTWRSKSDGTAWIYLTDADHSLHSAFAQEQYGYGEMNQSYGQWYPGHTGLGIELKDAAQIFSTAPFMLMSFSEMSSYGDGDDMMNFGITSYGQANDYRYSDALATDITIHYNGEEVLQGMNLDWEWPMVWSDEHHEPGEYVVTAINNNYMMGDIQGQNKAQMCFDNSRADYFPPAMQGFQVRNVNGALTSQFRSFDEIELRIAGGDFNIVKSDLNEWGGYSSWYAYDPAELKVEVAPHGTENFEAVSGIAEKDDYYWGFDQFWTVSLDDVVAEQADQWYDLRVTLTDPSGNYQTQLFSPAFHVDQATKLHTLGTEALRDGKFFQDGTVVICHDGKMYDVYGKMLK